MLKKTLFCLFFLSGFCGLLYQVIWIRLAFAAFGVITPVLSVIVSIFMLGLSVGSYLGGGFAKSLSKNSTSSLLLYYAGSEVIIGIGGLLVPGLFKFGEAALLSSGGMESSGYLLKSALYLGLSIFPWCVFMGATFPLMLGYLRQRQIKDTTGFSFLYTANVFGALAGVLVTAIFLIELLGFRHTLWVASGLNFTIAIICLVLAQIKSHSTDWVEVLNQSDHGTENRNSPQVVGAMGILVWLFLSGFSSMGLEVAWTRAFTPIIKTQVYSFALLLLIYLAATACGSWLYRRKLAKGAMAPLSYYMGWLAITALIQVPLNDPRTHKDAAGIIISIFPFCAMLGFLTPKLIDEFSLGDSAKMGRAYAINTLGCILGPLASSYILLPYVGVKWTMIFLALPFALFFLMEILKRREVAYFKLAYALGIIFLISALWATSYEDKSKNSTAWVYRDHVATVIATGEGMDKRLFVNGIGITHQTPITKVMAHFPLASLNHTPESALVICFGMGTTFRSLLTWGINVTAVELVPSVVKVFPYFFADFDQVLANPHGKIIVDDGRRYLRRSSDTFDVITLDPPPPVEAAGSSLLYSKEFYGDVKAHLKEGGILQQWFPGGEEAILSAVASSLSESFPYVKAYKSFEGWGFHFLASSQPLPNFSAEQLTEHMPEKAKIDLMEWFTDKNVAPFFLKVLGQYTEPKTLITQNPLNQITDDVPFNEYYLMRRAESKIAKLGKK